MKLDNKIIGLTFAGGALGSMLRYGLDFLTPNNLVLLFVVNVLGAALLGFVAARGEIFTDAARSFWGTGVAGGFTTMSGVTMLLLYVPVAMLAQSILGVGFYLFTRYAIRKLRPNA